MTEKYKNKTVSDSRLKQVIIRVLKRVYGAAACSPSPPSGRVTGQPGARRPE